MQRINHFKSATQAISAVLLFGIAYAAGADQMMRALPSVQSTAAPSVVQPGTAPTAVPVTQPPGTPVKPMSQGAVGISASGMKLPQQTNSNIAKPGQTLLPDLTFSSVKVGQTTYEGLNDPQPIIVNNFVTPPPSNTTRPGGLPSDDLGKVPYLGCLGAFTFPLQLHVRNIGQADFVPKDSFQVVGVTIGPWNSAKDIIKLPATAAQTEHVKRFGMQQGQTMSFSVTLPPGKYMLNASIDLHNGVAEVRTDNNKLSRPLEVRCEEKADTVMAPAIKSH